MKRRECSSSSISAAIDDLREFSKYQQQLFKVETEQMLQQTIKQVKKLAAEDSAKKLIKRMQKNDDQKITKSGEPQNMTDSSFRNSSIQPLNDHVRAGSALMDAAADAVNSDLEAEQERNGSISAHNEDESEIKSEEGAKLEELHRVNIQRKSCRMIKKPAWRKDFIT